jgi:hypothetical protein
MINKEETIYRMYLNEDNPYSLSAEDDIYFNADEYGRMRFDEFRSWLQRWRTKDELIKLLETIIFELEHNFKGEEEVESMAKSKDTKKETKKKPIKKSK